MLSSALCIARERPAHERARWSPTAQMKDSTLCHYHGERRFVSGLVLPNGVKVCYDKRAENEHLGLRMSPSPFGAVLRVW
jgi:predicted DNA-binding helix-hairpin-helix protein